MQSHSKKDNVSSNASLTSAELLTQQIAIYSKMKSTGSTLREYLELYWSIEELSSEYNCIRTINQPRLHQANQDKLEELRGRKKRIMDRLYAKDFSHDAFNIYWQQWFQEVHETNQTLLSDYQTADLSLTRLFDFFVQMLKSSLIVSIANVCFGTNKTINTNQTPFNLSAKIADNDRSRNDFYRLIISNFSKVVKNKLKENKLEKNESLNQFEEQSFQKRLIQDFLQDLTQESTMGAEYKVTEILFWKNDNAKEIVKTNYMQIMTYLLMNSFNYPEFVKVVMDYARQSDEIVTKSIIFVASRDELGKHGKCLNQLNDLYSANMVITNLIAYQLAGTCFLKKLLSKGNIFEQIDYRYASEHLIALLRNNCTNNDKAMQRNFAVFNALITKAKESKKTFHDLKQLLVQYMRTFITDSSKKGEINSLVEIVTKLEKWINDSNAKIKGEHTVSGFDLNHVDLEILFKIKLKESFLPEAMQYIDKELNFAVAMIVKGFSFLLHHPDLLALCKNTFKTEWHLYQSIISTFLYPDKFTKDGQDLLSKLLEEKNQWFIKDADLYIAIDHLNPIVHAWVELYHLKTGTDGSDKMYPGLRNTVHQVVSLNEEFYDIFLPAFFWKEEYLANSSGQQNDPVPYPSNLQQTSVNRSMKFIKLYILALKAYVNCAIVIRSIHADRDLLTKKISDTTLNILKESMRFLLKNLKTHTYIGLETLQLIKHIIIKSEQLFDIFKDLNLLNAQRVSDCNAILYTRVTIISDIALGLSKFYGENFAAVGASMNSQADSNIDHTSLELTERRIDAAVNYLKMLSSDALLNALPNYRANKMWIKDSNKTIHLTQNKLPNRQKKKLSVNIPPIDVQISLPTSKQVKAAPYKSSLRELYLAGLNDTKELIKSLLANPDSFALHESRLDNKNIGIVLRQDNNKLFHELIKNQCEVSLKILTRATIYETLTPEMQLRVQCRQLASLDAKFAVQVLIDKKAPDLARIKITASNDKIAFLETAIQNTSQFLQKDKPIALTNNANSLLIQGKVAILLAMLSSNNLMIRQNQRASDERSDLDEKNNLPLIFDKTVWQNQIKRLLCGLPVTICHETDSIIQQVIPDKNGHKKKKKIPSTDSSVPSYGCFVIDLPALGIWQIAYNKAKAICQLSSETLQTVLITKLQELLKDNADVSYNENKQLRITPLKPDFSPLIDKRELFNRLKQEVPGQIGKNESETSTSSNIAPKVVNTNNKSIKKNKKKASITEINPIETNPRTKTPNLTINEIRSRFQRLLTNMSNISVDKSHTFGIDFDQNNRRHAVVCNTRQLNEFGLLSAFDHLQVLVDSINDFHATKILHLFIRSEFQLLMLIEPNALTQDTIISLESNMEDLRRLYVQKREIAVELKRQQLLQDNQAYLVKEPQPPKAEMTKPNFVAKVQEQKESYSVTIDAIYCEQIKRNAQEIIAKNNLVTQGSQNNNPGKMANANNLVDEIKFLLQLLTVSDSKDNLQLLFSMYLMRLFECLAQLHSYQDKNIFNDWRNVLRHEIYMPQHFLKSANRLIRVLMNLFDASNTTIPVRSQKDPEEDVSNLDELCIAMNEFGIDLNSAKLEVNHPAFKEDGLAILLVDLNQLWKSKDIHSEAKAEMIIAMLDKIGHLNEQEQVTGKNWQIKFLAFTRKVYREMGHFRVDATEEYQTIIANLYREFEVKWQRYLQLSAKLEQGSKTACENNKSPVKNAIKPKKKQLMAAITNKHTLTDEKLTAADDARTLVVKQSINGLESTILTGGFFNNNANPSMLSSTHEHNQSGEDTKTAALVRNNNMR